MKNNPNSHLQATLKEGVLALADILEKVIIANKTEMTRLSSELDKLKTTNTTLLDTMNELSNQLKELDAQKTHFNSAMQRLRQARLDYEKSENNTLGVDFTDNHIIDQYFSNFLEKRTSYLAQVKQVELDAQNLQLDSQQIFHKMGLGDEKFQNMLDSFLKDSYKNDQNLSNSLTRNEQIKATQLELEATKKQMSLLEQEFHQKYKDINSQAIENRFDLVIKNGIFTSEVDTNSNPNTNEPAKNDNTSDCNL